VQPEAGDMWVTVGHALAAVRKESTCPLRFVCMLTACGVCGQTFKHRSLPG